MKPFKRTEAQEGRDLADWLNKASYGGDSILYTHVPLGGLRHSFTGAMLKVQGAKPGVPDYLIFTPVGGFRGVAIELKITGGTVSKTQKKWLSGLRDCGWHTLVAYGAQEAIKELEALGVTR